MANTFRRADIVGRLDDLRFAVLLTATGPVGARAARRRVLDSLPRGFVRTGLACYPRDGQDWRELLRAAGATPGEIFAASSTDWERGGSSLFDGPSEEVEAA